MKVKVVVVELELTRRQKLAAGCAVVVAVAAGTSVALATVKHDFKGGEKITAAAMNGNFEELDTRLAALEQQVHAPVAFSAHRSTNLTVSGGVTPLNFDQVVYDAGNVYDAATGTFTAPADGIYLTACATDWTVTGSYEVSSILSVNGVAQSGADTPLYGSTGNFARPETTDLLSLKAGQKVTCSAYHNSGGMLTVQGGPYTFFAAARLY
ncbi:MAG: hypothetical protein U0414_26070 [Polyangiaceae bacterium]